MGPRRAQQGAATRAGNVLAPTPSAERPTTADLYSMPSAPPVAVPRVACPTWSSQYESSVETFEKTSAKKRAAPRGGRAAGRRGGRGRGRGPAAPPQPRAAAAPPRGPSAPSTPEAPPGRWDAGAMDAELAQLLAASGAPPQRREPPAAAVPPPHRKLEASKSAPPGAFLARASHLYDPGRTAPDLIAKKHAAGAMTGDYWDKLLHSHHREAFDKVKRWKADRQAARDRELGGQAQLLASAQAQLQRLGGDDDGLRAVLAGLVAEVEAPKNAAPRPRPQPQPPQPKPPRRAKQPAKPPAKPPAKVPRRPRGDARANNDAAPLAPPPLAPPPPEPFFERPSAVEARPALATPAGEPKAAARSRAATPHGDGGGGRRKVSGAEHRPGAHDAPPGSHDALASPASPGGASPEGAPASAWDWGSWNDGVDDDDARPASSRPSDPPARPRAPTPHRAAPPDDAPAPSISWASGVDGAAPDDDDDDDDDDMWWPEPAAPADAPRAAPAGALNAASQPPSICPTPSRSVRFAADVGGPGDGGGDDEDAAMDDFDAFLGAFAGERERQRAGLSLLKPQP